MVGRVVVCSAFSKCEWWTTWTYLIFYLNSSAVTTLGTSLGGCQILRCRISQVVHRKHTQEMLWVVALHIGRERSRSGGIISYGTTVLCKLTHEEIMSRCVACRCLKSIDSQCVCFIFTLYHSFFVGLQTFWPDFASRHGHGYNPHDFYIWEWSRSIIFASTILHYWLRAYHVL